jgi:hypothetical protein
MSLFFLDYTFAGDGRPVSGLGRARLLVAEAVRAL